MRALVVAAAILGLLLVAAGAAGAHSVPVDAGGRWDSALLYGFVHTLAAVLAAALPLRSWLRIASGWAFIASVVMFSGVQIGKIMWSGMTGSMTTPLDVVSFLVPVGGVAFITGWLLMGLAALMSAKETEEPPSPPPS